MSTLITKHETFWFLDGNIILSIPSTGEPDSANDDTCSGTRPNTRKRPRRTEENSDTSSYGSSLSTKRTLFRVHKGILSKHSPVFEGMFTLPDPAESTNSSSFGFDAHGHLNKEYEGAPVVELSDTIEQVEQLLGALYDPFSLTLRDRDSELPIFILPLMEIANKYEVEGITKRIIDHIDADWPKTLEEWDKLDALFKVPDGDYDDLAPWGFRRRQHNSVLCPEPVAAINFAKRFKLHDILTAAFMELMRTPYYEDWNKYFPRQDEDTSKHWRILCARWSLLSPDDHTLLGDLRETIRYQASHYLGSGLSNYPTEDCTNKKRDLKVLLECRDYFQLRFSSAYDILRWTREYCHDSGTRKADRQRKFVVCRSCNKRIDSALENVRTMTWQYTRKMIYASYHMGYHQDYYI